MKLTSTENPETHWADPKHALPYNSITWDASQYLLFCSWFERLWMWQEVRLNSNNVILTCGIYTMLWNQIRNAIYCLRVKAEKPSAHLRDRIDHIFNLCDTADYARLENLMQSTKYCKFSDPRDRVYAVLSLVGEFEVDIGAQPDYARPVGEVYKDVVLQSVNKRGSLSFLNHCDMKPPIRLDAIPGWIDLTRSHVWEMPTKVPDLVYPESNF
jgi:hypothetical protein